MIIKEDFEGNKLFINDYGDVYLTLKGKKKKRIGMFYKEEEVLNYKKSIDEKKHIFKKTNSIGICNALLKYLGENSLITVDVPEKSIKYVLTKKELDEKKEYLKFQKQGFELQAFVKIEDWKKVPIIA